MRRVPRSPDVVMAALSLVAGLIHLQAGRDHLAELWLFGAFFFALALAQIAWSVLLMVRPSPALRALGMSGGILVTGLWVVSRSIGLPFGHHPWEPEAVGVADALSSLCQVLIAGMVLALSGPGRSSARTEPAVAEVVPITTAPGYARRDSRRTG